MRTIGILHYQVGRTDGVSLEIDKWKRVLEEMGHTVHLCAGDLGPTRGTVIAELYHHRPEIERLYRNTFEALSDYGDNWAYRAELYRIANLLESRIRDFVEEKGIDLIIAENVWSVAINPAASIALARVVRDMGLLALGHDHDFYWERETGIALTCATAVELAEKYLPPRGPGIRHAVINSLAQHEMEERKGIPSTIVPNVFDFEAPDWQVDEYNADFRQRIGLREKDILILQATRITPRKGIELAVDFVQALDTPSRRAHLKERGLYDGRPFDEDSRIVLVLAGYTRDDLSGTYTERLKRKIAESEIDALFIENLIEARRQTRAGEKIYTLWDSYVFADMVTFPSLEEGWGNQFLEGVRARLPVMVFEHPVYRADIKDCGFRVISLGYELDGRDEQNLARVPEYAVEAAADHAVELLTDNQRRQEAVTRNFEIASAKFSLKALRDYLSELVPA